MSNPGKLSPLLSHLLPGAAGGDGNSAALTPNLYPAGTDFYSGCVSISPAPAPGLPPVTQAAAAYSYGNVSVPPPEQKPQEALHTPQPMIHDVYSSRSWETAESRSSGVPSYCISETSCSAPVSMHGSIHARANGWNSDRTRKGDSKFHSKGASDMRRCVASDLSWMQCDLQRGADQCASVISSCDGCNSVYCSR